MTDLSDTEIVLGKLGARMLPVMGLVACSWPVMAISTLLGGIDPIALTLGFAIIVAVAILGCTLALVLSVWARKTHEVILATYTFFIVGMLFWPIWEGLSTTYGAPPHWTLWFNPFYMAFAPYADPDKVGLWDYLAFFGLTLGTSALLAFVAVRRTRPVANRGSIEKSRGPRVGLIGRIVRWLPGPSMDRNPVLWREWHRSRPSPWMMVILGLLMGTTGVLCIVGAVAFWRNGVSNGPGGTWEMAGVFSYILHIIFGLLMMSAIAPTSMAEERQRGSLDILAATTLSTRSIVVGKWLGTFRFVVFMAVCPALLALAMATGRQTSPMNFGAGLPPEYYKTITLGPRIYALIVLIATILAHGAVITSIGLALAVWFKRQSRAIAISVGLFILVMAAWPFFASLVFRGFDGRAGQGLASLSPIVFCTILINTFTMRVNIFGANMIWWGTFWAAEVFTMAFGLLGLTVLTFDRCFDRISDRPGRISVRAAVVMILAALIGAGSLVGAVGVGIEGVVPHDLAPGANLPILCYSILTAVGLVLAAIIPASTIASRRRSPAHTLEEPTPDPARRFVMGQWWQSFRLVPLLAIGPGILAIALGIAHKTVVPVAKNTTLPSGAQVTTWEEPSPEQMKVERIGEVRLVPRLLAAALLVLTILVHGAAVVSLGLALAIAIEKTRRAIAAGFGLAFMVVVFLPIFLSLVLDTAAPPGVAMWNFVMASHSLLLPLLTRIEPDIAEILVSVLLWNIAVSMCAAGLLWWSIRRWQIQRAVESVGKPTFGFDTEVGSATAETVFVSQ